MSFAADLAAMETSLAALGDGYDGLPEELMDAWIAAHPRHAPAFMNPAAACERMTRETLEALLGAAQDAPWVGTTVVNFVDLHRNYGVFSAGDYADWFELTIARMEKRAGADWPPAASGAWRRQARRLSALVEEEIARDAAARAELSG
jgi:hypothetical protein